MLKSENFLLLFRHPRYKKKKPESSDCHIIYFSLVMMFVWKCFLISAAKGTKEKLWHEKSRKRKFHFSLFFGAQWNVCCWSESCGNFSKNRRKSAVICWKKIVFLFLDISSIWDYLHCAFHLLENVRLFVFPFVRDHSAEKNAILFPRMVWEKQWH